MKAHSGQGKPLQLTHPHQAATTTTSKTSSLPLIVASSAPASNSNSDNDEQDSTDEKQSQCSHSDIQRKSKSKLPQPSNANKKKKSKKPVRDPLARRGQINQDNFTEVIVAARQSKRNESKYLPVFYDSNQLSSSLTRPMTHPYRSLISAVDFRYILGEIDGSKFDYCGRPEIEIALIDLRPIQRFTPAALIARHQFLMSHESMTPDEREIFNKTNSNSNNDYLITNLQQTIVTTTTNTNNDANNNNTTANTNHSLAYLQALLSSPTAVKLLFDPLQNAFYLSQEIQDELIELYQLAIDRNESSFNSNNNEDLVAPPHAHNNNNNTSKRRQLNILKSTNYKHNNTSGEISGNNSGNNTPARQKSISANHNHISPQRARSASQNNNNNNNNNNINSNINNKTPPQNRPRTTSANSKSPNNLTPTSKTHNQSTFSFDETVNTESDSDYNNLNNNSNKSKATMKNNNSNKKRKDKKSVLKEGDIGKITIPKCLLTAEPPLQNIKLTPTSSAQPSPYISPQPSARRLPSILHSSNRNSVINNISDKHKDYDSNNNNSNNRKKSRSGSASARRMSSSPTVSRPVSPSKLDSKEAEEDFAVALGVFDRSLQTDNLSHINGPCNAMVGNLDEKPVALTIDSPLLYETHSFWSLVLVTTYTQFGKPGPDTWQMLFTMNSLRQRLWSRFVKLFLQPVLEDYDLYVAWQQRRQAFYEAQQLLMGQALEEFDFDMLSLHSGSIESQHSHYIFPQNNPAFLVLQEGRLQRLKEKKEQEQSKAVQQAARLEAKRLRGTVLSLAQSGQNTANSSSKIHANNKAKRLVKSTGQQIAEGLTMMQRMKMKKESKGSKVKRLTQGKQLHTATAESAEDTGGDTGGEMTAEEEETS